MTTQVVNTESENQIAETSDTFSEQQFRKLIGRMQKTVTKVRRIDLPELLEFAWVDGLLEPFAERLLRSRPDLKDDIDMILNDLRAAD
jgi:reverse gyrase